MDPQDNDKVGGLSGALKAVAALSVIFVALVAILAVLGVLPREVLQEWAVKAGLVVLIIVAAAVALAMIGRSGR